MELCIFEGGVFYGFWRQSDAYACTREAIGTIVPVAPLIELIEFGGMLWQSKEYPSLDEAVAQTRAHQHTVVTVGVYSFALFRTELGGYELFDSHAQADFGNKAVLLRFDSLDHLLQYLRMRYSYSGTSYSVTCVVAAKEQQALQIPFQDELMAWEAVDKLPGGSALFNVWKYQDTFVVASVYAFTSKKEHILLFRREKQRIFFHTRVAINDETWQGRHSIHVFTAPSVE
jgi:hypothetical protein